MATGTRVRYNFAKGRLGVALTTGDVTVDLGEDPGWSSLGAGEYIAMTLSDREIVHVTDYTAGATTCTVQRGQEGTTAVSHALNAPWVAGYTTRDFDYAELDNIGGDQHPDMLNNERHDVTARHPITVLGDGSGLGLRAKDYVTATTTFAKANYPWLRLLVVRLVGAGGGGAAASASAGTAGGGGGSGEYAEIALVPGALLATEDLTIGAPGAGGTAGANAGSSGTSTLFGSHAAAGGGGGGGHLVDGGVPNATTGSAGTGGYGAFTFDGQVGDYALTTTNWTIGGKGADSPFGRGGAATILGDGTSTPGLAASGYGAGGSGAANDGATAQAGGAGSSGLIILELYG